MQNVVTQFSRIFHIFRILIFFFYDFLDFLKSAMVLLSFSKNDGCTFVAGLMTMANESITAWTSWK